MTGLKSDPQPSSKIVMQHLYSIKKKKDYYALRDLSCGSRGKPTSQKMNGANAVNRICSNQIGLAKVFPPSELQVKYIFLYVEPRHVLETGMCTFMFLADVRAAQWLAMITRKHSDSASNRKGSEHAYSVDVRMQQAYRVQWARCGVLSLCGPARGCGVRQEMCEPWRHVFMLAAAAHHQPEGKQTPAPLC